MIGATVLSLTSNFALAGSVAMFVVLGVRLGTIAWSLPLAIVLLLASIVACFFYFLCCIGANDESHFLVENSQQCSEKKESPKQVSKLAETNVRQNVPLDEVHSYDVVCYGKNLRYGTAAEKALEC